MIYEAEQRPFFGAACTFENLQVLEALGVEDHVLELLLGFRSVSLKSAWLNSFSGDKRIIKEHDGKAQRLEGKILIAGPELL